MPKLVLAPRLGGFVAAEPVGCDHAQLYQINIAVPVEVTVQPVAVFPDFQAIHRRRRHVIGRQQVLTDGNHLVDPANIVYLGLLPAAVGTDAVKYPSGTIRSGVRDGGANLVAVVVEFYRTGLGVGNYAKDDPLVGREGDIILPTCVVGAGRKSGSKKCPAPVLPTTREPPGLGAGTFLTPLLDECPAVAGKGRPLVILGVEPDALKTAFRRHATGHPDVL